jgi:hydrogenase/urease accessory protein HupE
MNFRLMQVAIFTALGLLLAAARAHPIPDIPVRTFFPGDSSMRVTVEVDPRCLAADPDLEASLLPARLAEKTPEQRAELERKAGELVQRWIEFTLEPIGRVQPDFRFTFTGKGETPLRGAEDVVVLTGEWRTTLATGLSGWRIRSLPEAKLSVVFQNIIRGQTHPRLAVLFPGESSFTLDLADLASASALPDSTRVAASGTPTDSWSTFAAFFRQGFIHVVPEGLDHILFVLGLFLLSRAWRPLLAQVTTFTLAHSVTLALATLGYVKVPASLVEPVIAASIAVVALENIFRPRYTHWRLLVVFAFGLIHGLGFASVLSDLDLPGSALVAGLVGFNLGVEGGQLTVIAAAFLATMWLREPGRYRRWIVIPGSAAIALLGIWWALERTMGT